MATVGSETHERNIISCSRPPIETVNRHALVSLTLTQRTNVIVQHQIKWHIRVIYKYTNTSTEKYRFLSV